MTTERATHILGRKFTLRAEEPLGTSYRTLPEVVEFRSADWAAKYFSAQSARSSRRVTQRVFSIYQEIPEIPDGL